jgi:hypothetical protein
VCIYWARFFIGDFRKVEQLKAVWPCGRVPAPNLSAVGAASL